MGTYRTAQGKMIDMAALAAKNEKARAVGNMKVNARGDTIDAEGRIIVPVTEKVADKYAKTVGQRSAQTRTKLQPNKAASKPKMELTEEEKELLSADEDDAEVEAIKAKEMKK
jgi:hypothetical protein